jgi:A/G-specific adenine glycosylase
MLPSAAVTPERSIDRGEEAPAAPAGPSEPSTAELGAVRRAILACYDAGHRDLPWRGVRDPYGVLVSEVMLQQTQAPRIAGRFEAFMRRFPTVDALATAPPADVLHEWRGLGYYRRALALQRTAAIVARDGWPRDVVALQRLPGVGPYTARAVASLAFSAPVGPVDTNVRRWLSRRFGAYGARLQPLADRLAAGPPEEAASWTHASMEFGAAICRARKPRCAACPVADGCPVRGEAPRVAVRGRPSYGGSRRAARGAVLRALTEAHPRALTLGEAQLATGLPAAPFREAVGVLVADGLVDSRGRSLHLGHG